MSDAAKLSQYGTKLLKEAEQARANRKPGFRSEPPEALGASHENIRVPREGDFNSGTGAVRSADADELDFTSIPWIGLIGVARTAQEGGTKYGQFNYMKGFTVLNLLNHSIRHIAMFILGDRSEPHLEHAAWGILAAIQSYTLNPELSAPHLLGPGATLTAAMKAHLDKNEPILAAKRKAGVFDKIGEWSLHKLKEIQTILGQRYKYAGMKPVLDDVPAPAEEPAPKPRKPYNVVLNKSIRKYVKKEAIKRARNAERNLKLSAMLREKGYFRTAPDRIDTAWGPVPSIPPGDHPYLGSDALNAPTSGVTEWADIEAQRAMPGREDAIVIPADVCKEALDEVRKMAGHPNLTEGDVIYGWPNVAKAGLAAELLRRKDKDSHGYYTKDFAPTNLPEGAVLDPEKFGPPIYGRDPRRRTVDGVPVRDIKSEVISGTKPVPPPKCPRPGCQCQSI